MLAQHRGFALLKAAGERLAAWSVRHGGAVSLVVAVVLVAYFAVSVVHFALDGHPLSYLDEHVHFDTALKLHAGQLSYRGALVDQGVVQEWACGVGHQAGPPLHGCGNRELSASSLPSGKYTSGYIHYPTYFVLAGAFRWLVDLLPGDHSALNVYRLFSAVCLILGVIASGVAAYALGIRRVGLVAAVTVPVAASTIVVMGGIVNPNSLGVLCGALIAGTGVAWIRRGRGFIWFALAAAFGSSVAVVCSLPVGGFLLAMLVALVARRFGWRVSYEQWRPRWWQLVTIAAIVLAPVVIWGRYIAATATVSNAEVYGNYPFRGWGTLLIGVFAELGLLHTPWVDWEIAMATNPDFTGRLMRAVGSGWPVWITALIFGGLVFTVLRSNFDERMRFQHTDFTRRNLNPVHLLAIGTLATLILYPAAMRFSNVLTFGMDVSIVARYSIAFGPLLIILLLLRVKQRATHWLLSGAGAIGMITVAGVWL
jgi:hypothetical protein